ncbi:MAG: hypothetical protein IJP68_10760, partial [Selenomonadaceae bacterium]|nr:hypothetical protein [Selenomonadaceae bacterium]
GGKGNDYIVNYGDAATTSIITGDGEDSITNYATNVTIAAGAGNDSVFSNGASSIINLGTGNDFLHNRGNNTSINLGDDDDTVITDASNVTIRGGAGNDRISLEGDAKDVVINYTAGDGNDTIWGLTKDNAKLRIKGVKYYSTVPSGDDVIVKVGENTITLKNFRDKPSDIIIGASGSSGGTGGNNGGSTGGNGGSTGGTSGSNSNSAASGGNSAGGSSGSNSSSNGSSGNGNRNYSSSRTTSVQQNVVTVPSGNQFFSNYQSGQKLYLGSEYTGAFFDNAGDFVAGSATGAICVRNALDKVIDFSDGAGNLIKAYAARNAGLIDGRNIAGREIINGSKGSDTIYAGDGGSQLWGGEGFVQDILVGGGGSDTFLSGKGHGADLIRNASSADVVYLKDAALSDITATSESNGMISVSFNTGNVINVQSTESMSARFNLTDGSAYRYNHTTKAWETLQQAPPTANQSTFTGDNQFISAGRYGDKIVLDTNFTDMNYDGGSNFVVNAPTGSLVVRNALDKVIDLSNVKGTPITKAYAASTPGLIDGRGLAGREIINGSAGADVICAGDGGSQLWGGADNAADVLIGGDGQDVFIGGKNQGADLILNASVEDVVNFNDATIA